MQAREKQSPRRPTVTHRDNPLQHRCLKVPPTFSSLTQATKDCHKGMGGTNAGYTVGQQRTNSMGRLFCDITESGASLGRAAIEE